ncbi:hypothetical protein C2S52_004622 [Perilla frutescens var. hirtella]|uniref:Uncharacterized protein n=1 Tax=Perilla frutescens var. hirtella TaxID=608512 RepID=A0AAD4IR82_PERFH|nr:hypothetical protein C2S51_010979 [Perilla frutescens var. frutescens]KAH6794145.1 hypothetical protein C2S52_004622 [Perilla frutescens var. hirtella]KAH6820063.1 hypothetical protein C2S53_013637 [Perilla frutescens var. hirtella]
MDGEKKKRKMEETEEDEEEKMEKFFALIKSTREVRERLVTAAENKERPAADKKESTPPPWNPTFMLEDFVEAAPPVVEKAGTSNEGEKQVGGEKRGGLDLDLNLSL